jgi:cilia- and flagella-associated protein 57
VESEKWDEIEAIKEKNKQELADKIDKGMHEKASLTLIQNDHRDKNAQKLGFQNRINQMQEKLNTELNDQANKRQLQKSQKGELNERDTTIVDKEKKITELYKKTQDLEKFKFVLDYKIKELKREIGPRETAIQ